MIERVLFFSDPHIPYEDKRAWNLLLKVAKGFGPHIIAMLGDFLDMGSVSRHLKDPRKYVSVVEEFKQGNKALDQLDALKAKRKIYIAGNHEDRLARYLQERAPELLGTLSFEEKLRLKERKWEVVQYRDHTRIGKIYLTHDVGTAGRYAVYRALEAFEHSVVTAHTHRISYIVEGNALGQYKVAASFGWLGDAKAVDYMYQVKLMKDWALGFGLGYHNTDTGIVHVVPVPIVNYTATVEGTLYKA